MEPLVAIREISFAYDTRIVLKGVSISAGEREFIGLIGPNGSGKSTLLRSLLGLLPITAGDIRLSGRQLGTMSRTEIARHITLVPQDTSIDLPFLVREIVAMGRTPYLGRFRPEGAADKAAVEHALRVTETESLAERAVSELSGGERQRVAIARAIAQETRVILLDEPTSNLDLAHQLEVLSLIRNIADDGKCAVAALHDLTLAARFCTRILLMSCGEIVADASSSAVITEANLARFFGIHARVTSDDVTGDLMIWPISPIEGSS